MTLVSRRVLPPINIGVLYSYAGCEDRKESMYPSMHAWVNDHRLSDSVVYESCEVRDWFDGWMVCSMDLDRGAGEVYTKKIVSMYTEVYIVFIFVYFHVILPYLVSTLTSLFYTVLYTSPASLSRS